MSNVYPVWWDKTVTLYNKFADPQTKEIFWYRHILSGCFWKDTGEKVQIGETTVESDTILCRVPKSDAFLEKYLWNGLEPEQKQTSFTIGVGDILVSAEVDDAIDEYQKGSRSSDLLQKYKDLGCMTVTKASLNVGPGRCCEHYLVKGV